MKKNEKSMLMKHIKADNKEFKRNIKQTKEQIQDDVKLKKQIRKK